MRPLFGSEEKAELMAYLDEDGFFTEFKKTEAFECQIAEFTGARHCIVVNNGTVSLTLAAIALGVGPGDEVIVPDYTMIATPNSVKMLGAQPVFVDVDPDTLILDMAATRAAITPRTRAIMLVSANGRAPACGIKAFEDLAHETGVALIEDAAQSLGSRYADGRHIGRAGAIGSFSFSAPKIISTGQGGALITDDDGLANKLRRLKDFGRAAGGTDVHDSIGYNFKFTELQACVGLAQMRQLPERIERKKEIWRRYTEGLTGIPGIQLFAHDLNHPGAADALVNAVIAGGQLDGVVVAHGVVAFGPLAELDAATLAALTQLNYTGPIQLIHAAIPSLTTSTEAGNEPFVLTISGVIADMPTAGMAAYGAGKAGLKAFMMAGQRELRRTGIRLIDTRPPHTETGLAGRAIAGTAPTMPQGLSPEAVAGRIVAAIVTEEKDVPADAFVA